MIFIAIDFKNQVAMADDGGIYGIEYYLDELEDPCCFEEASYVCIKTGSKCKTVLISDIIRSYNDRDY